MAFAFPFRLSSGGFFLKSFWLGQRKNHVVQLVSTLRNASTGVSVTYEQGYPIVRIPLASRPETCAITLQPVSHTVADFIRFVRAEDGGIDRVGLFHSDGSRIAQATPIAMVMWSDFKLVINDREFEVKTPAEGKVLPTAFDAMATYGDVKAMIQKLYVALNIEEHQRQKEKEIESEIERLEHELKPLEQQHVLLAKQSHFRTNILVWGGLAYLAAQFGFLARLTWWEYSWDIMEPVTYFVGQGFALAAYAYFVLTREDYVYPGARDRQYLSFLHRGMTSKGVDVRRYNELKDALAHKKDQLRCLHDALQLNLTAPRKLRE